MSGAMARTGKPDNAVDVPIVEIRPKEIFQAFSEIRKFAIVASRREQVPFAIIGGEGSTFIRVSRHPSVLIPQF